MHVYMYVSISIYIYIYTYIVVKFLAGGSEKGEPKKGRSDPGTTLKVASKPLSSDTGENNN